MEITFALVHENIARKIVELLMEFRRKSEARRNELLRCVRLWRGSFVELCFLIILMELVSIDGRG